MGVEVFLNDRFVPREEARVDIEDRGLQFGDGLYEVVAVREGRPLWLTAHLERLFQGAREILLPLPFPLSEWQVMLGELIRRNGLRQGILYLQVTRGVASRDHAFPVDVTPTVIAYTRETAEPTALLEEGAAAITRPDDRWGKPFIKAIGLLPNLLAKEEAHRAGAREALYLRNGFLTEGSSSNAFVVRGGVLITHGADREILSGITRRVVIDLARAEGLWVREEAASREELFSADEVFLTGTTTQVMGVVRLDGRPVGSGTVGPLTRRLQHAFREAMAALPR